MVPIPSLLDEESERELNSRSTIVTCDLLSVMLERDIGSLDDAEEYIARSSTPNGGADILNDAIFARELRRYGLPDDASPEDYRKSVVRTLWLYTGKQAGADPAEYVLVTGLYSNVRAVELLELASEQLDGDPLVSSPFWGIYAWKVGRASVSSSTLLRAEVSDSQLFSFAVARRAPFVVDISFSRRCPLST